ncbi:rubredoxin [Methanomicrobium antiquum]|uniref:Rubredoxin n=1 Tax=Methanomicrobium antiquum TaxID=487686 RepID=A0AAF0FKZ9_9EURY|nr:rubredoxin [Methanomicrobium antiquum]MDD3976818.1 rubredoxin [Methanomicrobium sp.]WFN35970.1 rubredoxin [Methanomicrobium antiquum]
MTGKKMKCMVCGHVYDPDKGDRDVDAGTIFSDIPAGWKCPVCGAQKASFKEI